MKCEYGLVTGRVQGVGFRYFVRQSAEAVGLSGWANNLADGRVEVLLCGPSALVERVKAKVEQGTEVSFVEGVEWQLKQVSCPTQFTTA